jgi:sporulation protein YqfC
MRSWKDRLRRATTEWLSLPPDALLDVSRLTCIDGTELVIENAVSLVKVSETEVDIEMTRSLVRLQGQSFIVTLVAEREIHVQGQVSQITYLDKIEVKG